MSWQEPKWSRSDKKVAREAFDAALESALAKIMAEFKSKANAVTEPSEMWAIGGFLSEKRREIDEIFDYRYSQLPLVFARLILAGQLDERRIAGLSEEILAIIRRYLDFARSQ